jgi:hypothetical protein
MAKRKATYTMSEPINVEALRQVASFRMARECWPGTNVPIGRLCMSYVGRAQNGWSETEWTDWEGGWREWPGTKVMNICGGVLHRRLYQ